MNKETVNGIEYTNFGSNNYSRGLEAVSFDPKDITPEEVSKLPGFFLHPSLEPNSCEIFALKGTFPQYLEFLKVVVDVKATEYAVSIFGLNPQSWDEFRETEQRFKDRFRPWFWE